MSNDLGHSIVKRLLNHVGIVRKDVAIAPQPARPSQALERAAEHGGREEPPLAVPDCLAEVGG